MSEQFTFKRAQRSQARLRLALAAVSGAGKTYSALRLARGICEHYVAAGLAQMAAFEAGDLIAVIDTERNSAQLYDRIVPFRHLGLTPPYSVDRYNQALHAAEQAGFLVIILDQITHAWAGPGGQLEWIDAMKAGGAKNISPWAKATPVQQDFYDRMLRSPAHLIVTMRSKSEWVLEEIIADGGRKKTVPRKIGMSPVQREGIEYEFTTCLDIDLDSHMATSTKDRTQLFDGRTVKLDEEVGKQLAMWLLEGVAAAPLGAPSVQAQAQQQGAGNTGAGAPPPVGDERPPTADDLESDMTDYELQFLEVATLPELASLFDAAQKHARSFVGALGAPVVKPYLDRVIKAKDARKLELQKGQQPAGVEGVSSAPNHQTGDGASSRSAAPPAASAGSADLLAGAGTQPAYVSPDDAVQLESICLSQGLAREEGLKALGADSFSKVLLSEFATSVDLLKLAARQKLDRADAAGKGGARRRTKAAA